MPAVPIVAAVTGAATAVGAAVASTIGFATISSAAATAIGAGIISGATTAVMGGDASDVLESAVVGGATSFIGSSVAPGIANAVTEATGSVIVGNVAAGAITGGISAEASGGDFEEGALLGGLTAGVTTALDEAKLATQMDAFENAMTESGLAGQTSVGPEDLAPYTPTTDFTVAPDYSLSTGGSNIGLQVPTINEVVDVIAGPVDYSLTPPPEGTGLTIPPVLGDEQSFINQPAYNVDANIADIPSTLGDTATTTAILDAAKSVAPSVISAALAPDIAQQEEQTGFPILPVPSDWRSPEYNMAFTPSAPIDFGSLELLRGTQWENPITLSALINTLNQNAPEFRRIMTEFQAPEVPYTTGVNDIIGNLRNQPVSISDIISKIQSEPNVLSKPVDYALQPTDVRPMPTGGFADLIPTIQNETLVPPSIPSYSLPQSDIRPMPVGGFSDLIQGIQNEPYMAPTVIPSYAIPTTAIRPMLVGGFSDLISGVQGGQDMLTKSGYDPYLSDIKSMPTGGFADMMLGLKSG